jgi:DNA (cytosine-5)-methyltransferase 1
MKTNNEMTAKKASPLGSGAATGYTVLDLFSGIGGFSLGLEMAGGFETIAFCEIDPGCRKILKKHWPNVPIFEDVRTIENVNADIVCGGYPCQPFSVAGSQKAQEDDRHLWPEMLRVVAQVRPTWVIAENVYGHVKLGLDKVLHDLEGEGYTARPVVVPSLANGADHNRDRVFIIAYSSSNGRNESKITGRNGKADEYRKERKDKNSNNERFGSLRARMEGEGNTARRRRIEPPEIRGDDGFPNRMDRNRMIGNSVDPRTVEAIGRAIVGA